MNKLTVNLATRVEREDLFRQVMEDFIGQTPRMNIYLDGYKELPQWLPAMAAHFPKGIGVSIPHPGHSLLGAGKFSFVKDCPLDEPYLTIDDDLRYPKDYVETMVGHLKRHELDIIGVHGIEMHHNIQSYYKSRVVWVYTEGNEILRAVDCVGTGAMAFFPMNVPILPQIFPTVNPQMLDIHVGRIAVEVGARILCIPRAAGWLRDTPNPHWSIFKTYKDHDHLQTTLARSIDWRKH